jgi:hypothetical protein
VNHPLFQRLNHIRQLGNAFRVFPGAQHTRFSHSLGVMYLMDKMIGSGNIGEFEKSERQKLRLAALLHDIGHYPFSHAIETIYTNNGRNSEGKHENFGAYVLSNYSIKDILGENYSHEEISNIFLSRSDKIIYNQLMSSEFDVDRCDYLLRDSLNTGVTHGKFDIDRMIYTLRISNDGYLGIHEKGIRAADGYIIGRYLMWTTVYTHKTISAYDEILKAAYKNLILDQYSNLDKLKKCSEQDLIKFNDNFILTEIYDNIDSQDEYTSNVCNMYCNRSIEYRLGIADEEKHYSVDEMRSQKYYQLNAYNNERTLQRLVDRNPDIQGWVFPSAAKTKLPYLQPMMHGELFRLNDIGDLGEEMMKVLYIIDDHGEPNIYGLDKHSLSRHLINLSYDVVRIYTKQDLMPEVKRLLQEDMAEYG